MNLAAWRLTAFVAAVYTVAGCRAPVVAVSVDIGRVLASETVKTPPTVEMPSPPSGMPAASVALPGRPPETLKDPSRSTESDVRFAIERRQHEEFLRLVDRLREFYDADNLRFRQEQERDLSRQEVAAYEAANDEIRRLFVQYGEQRGPLVAELALLAGFPDPNPESKVPAVKMGNVAQQRFDRSKQLREQIGALEAQFDAQSERILGTIDAQLRKNHSAMLEQIRQYRIANDARATREANAQVRQHATDLGLRLAEPMRLQLHSVAPTSTSLPATPAPAAPPQVSSEGVLADAQSRERMIRSQVAIWAAQHRYRIEAGADDKTQEFMEWRNRLVTGR